MKYMYMLYEIDLTCLKQWIFLYVIPQKGMAIKGHAEINFSILAGCSRAQLIHVSICQIGDLGILGNLIDGPLSRYLSHRLQSR